MDTNIEPIPETLESHLNVGAPFSWSQAKIEEQLEARKALCEQIFEKAGDDHDMRKVTVLKGDSSSKVKQLKQLNDDIKLLMGCRLVPHIGHPSGPDRAFGSGDGGGSFVEAIRRAKWDPVTRHRVTVPAEAALFKAVTTTGDIEDYFPRTVPSTGFGADRRYLYPAIRQVSLSAADTSVQYLNQSARTLAATNDMIRAIDAVSSKPETALTVELASADLKQVAHKVSGVPNIVTKQRPFRDLIEGDLRLGLSEALDAMVSSAITVAGIPMGSAGADVAQKIRYAMAVVEAAGYSPDTVALSPDEAVELDLILLETNNSTGTGPLFGLRPRVSKALSLGIVFDSRAFATLHAGPLEFASFEENDGATNSMLFRAELNAVAVVDREAAGCELWVASEVRGLGDAIGCPRAAHAASSDPVAVGVGRTARVPQRPGRSFTGYEIRSSKPSTRRAVNNPARDQSQNAVGLPRRLRPGSRSLTAEQYLPPATPSSLTSSRR